jgi:hypothetical protein
MHMTKEQRVEKFIAQFKDEEPNYYEFKEHCLQFFHTISKEYDHDDLEALETYMKQVECRGAYPIMDCGGAYADPPEGYYGAKVQRQQQKVKP